jgi:predicted Zn-dependent protease with MMP-like domain
MDALARAWEAWDAGDAEGALGALAAVAESAPDTDRGYAACLESLVRGALGDPRGAGTALERAAALLVPDDPGLLWARGEWHLAAWREDEARRDFEALGDAPAALERRALLADLADDHEEADRLMDRAAALDPEGPGPPPRLTPDAFERVVAEAAGALPPQFTELLERVPVLIEPMPERSHLGGDLHLGPEILGLFAGASLLDASALEGLDEPARIHLYQRNLERSVHDETELCEEIRVTLYHELGHLLGFDEEGVDGLGLA